MSPAATQTGLRQPLEAVGKGCGCDREDACIGETGPDRRPESDGESLAGRHCPARECLRTIMLKSICPCIGRIPEGAGAAWAPRSRMDGAWATWGATDLWPGALQVTVERTGLAGGKRGAFPALSPEWSHVVTIAGSATLHTQRESV